MPYAPDFRNDLKILDANENSGSSAANTINVGFKPSFAHTYQPGKTNGGYFFGEPFGLKIIDADADTLVDDANALTGYVANGFTHGTSTKLSTNNAQTVYACWKGSGNTGAVNTTGSITANVSSNASIGFSVTKYTGTGSAGATIPHGLGKKPEVILFKCTSSATGQGAFCAEIPNRDQMNFANGDIMRTTQSGGKFQDTNVLNGTDPTKTLITLGNSSRVNDSGKTYLAVCWKSIKGIVKAGYYTGFSQSDKNITPFVYTGFKPGLIIIKNVTSSAAWNIQYLLNHTGYQNTGKRFTNPKDGEYGWGGGTSHSDAKSMFIFSNGFRVCGSGGPRNDQGKQYFYIAFAHEALVSTNNIPTTGV